MFGWIVNTPLFGTLCPVFQTEATASRTSKEKFLNLFTKFTGKHK